MGIVHCFGCFSLQNGVRAIALIMTIASFVGLCFGHFLENCFSGNYQHDFNVQLGIGLGLLLPSYLELLFNILLIVGSHKLKPTYIAPWLILNIIIIVAAYVVCLTFLGFGIAVVCIGHLDNEWTINMGDKGDPMFFQFRAFLGGFTGVFIIVMSAVCLVLTMVFTYIWAVVRALFMIIPNKIKEDPEQAPLNPENEVKLNIIGKLFYIYFFLKGKMYQRLEKP